MILGYTICNFSHQDISLVKGIEANHHFKDIENGLNSVQIYAFCLLKTLNYSFPILICQQNLKKNKRGWILKLSIRMEDYIVV